MINYTKPIVVKIDKSYNYAYFIDKQHPLASNNAGRVHLHRHVASLKYGRWLTSEDVVHHRDSNRLNNDPDNLEVTSRSAHAIGHAPKRQSAVCPGCHRVFIKSRPEQARCSKKCFGVLPKTSGELAEVIAGCTTIAEAARTLGVSWPALAKCGERLGVELPRRAKAIKKKLIRPRTGLVHGTRTGYVHYKCRCGSCRAANTTYAKR